MVWDRSYETARDDGYLMSACVFSDGGFAVGMQLNIQAATPAASGGPAQFHAEARLLRFSADGTRQWTADPGRTPAGSLERLFALADGSIICVGTVETVTAGQNGQVRETRNLVSVQRFDRDGKPLAQQALVIPGSASGGHQLLQGASWSEGVGLVIAWRYFLTAPAVRDPADQGTCLTALTADLQEKWSVRLPACSTIGETVALAGSAGILATGTAPAPSGTAPAASGSAPAASGSDTTTRSTLFHFSLQGSLDWSFAAGAPSTWLLAPARLSDGRIVLGQYQVRSDGSEGTDLFCLNADGSPNATLAELPGRLEKLVPAGDGGFTAVLRQVVQALPQPPYISSLWQDSEAIVCRFDRGLNLTWRRTIDQYKWERRSDLIVVSAMDRLFVG